MEFAHDPVVTWVEQEWLKEHNTPPRDPWRTIRKLHQQGILIKVKKGVYKYDPEFAHWVALWDFPPRVRAAVLKRDGYRCVMCGRGYHEGIELVVDHIVPKDKGGTNEMSNAQTLCMEHNLLKKNYSQTETGKRYFMRLYKKALVYDDVKMIAFCRAIFDVYDAFGVDKHTERPDSEEQMLLWG